MEKKPTFYFLKWQIPHISTKQDRLRGYQAFYSRHFYSSMFYRDENDIAPDDHTI